VQALPGNPLQPEAIGAVMEVTKWLKPSISVSRIGDSASVQAAVLGLITSRNCVGLLPGKICWLRIFYSECCWI